ncbi:GIY-YIG nuclease family protein [Desulfovulcanus ferrireducens]|uniref:GIY-YIG nuclease family protein n=1 Tax=Desulfovulcanus ferrireducens TaxID=2831190 RepID=UPI0025A3C6F4|nr:GIY-YIG nuclease family protein [Desulfovulcanus ferrireducens]
MKKGGCVYIMSNKSDKVLYTGVTNDLVRRVYEHKKHMVKGFTDKYNVNKLVYYEIFDSIEEAIRREKQIKGWKRCKKLELIQSKNPNWNDLWKDIIAS